MKYYIQLKVIFLLTLVASTVGCDSFTEVDLPESQLTAPAVYQDGVTATAALSDIYARMRDNGVVSGNVDGLTQLMGVYSDELTFHGTSIATMDGFFNHSVTPTNGYIATYWSSSYSHIYAANALIEGINSSPAIMGEQKSRLNGEGLFIRALIHFHLVNLFGDIPYITSTDFMINSKVTRIPKAIVYEKIISDLIQAKTLIPETYPTSGRVRPNKSVVQALLSRVYLYNEQWNLAEQESSAVINNKILYNPEPKLALSFLKESTSTIWQLHPGVAGANTIEGKSFTFISTPPPLTSVSDNLLNAFQLGDQRKFKWLKSVTKGNLVWYHPYKYKENVYTGTSKEYSIIFRVEEQYLIRAEARAYGNDITNGLADLNTIRNRAGLPDITVDSPKALIQAILQERRLELFSEGGHRWFDLKRTGQAQAVLQPLKPGWQNTQLLFPLPDKELLLNTSLKPQNPGY
jgi:hypothetical protein